MQIAGPELGAAQDAATEVGMGQIKQRCAGRASGFLLLAKRPVRQVQPAEVKACCGGAGQPGLVGMHGVLQLAFTGLGQGGQAPCAQCCQQFVAFSFSFQQLAKKCPCFAAHLGQAPQSPVPFAQGIQQAQGQKKFIQRGVGKFKAALVGHISLVNPLQKRGIAHVFVQHFALHAGVAGCGPQLVQPGIQPVFQLQGADTALLAGAEPQGQIGGQGFFVFQAQALFLFVAHQPVAGHLLVQQGSGDALTCAFPGLNLRQKLLDQRQGKGSPGQFAQVVDGFYVRHQCIGLLAGERGIQVLAYLRIGQRQQLQCPKPVWLVGATAFPCQVFILLGQAAKKLGAAGDQQFGRLCCFCGGRAPACARFFQRAQQPLGEGEPIPLPDAGQHFIQPVVNHQGTPVYGVVNLLQAGQLTVTAQPAIAHAFLHGAFADGQWGFIAGCWAGCGLQHPDIDLAQVKVHHPHAVVALFAGIGQALCQALHGGGFAHAGFTQ